MIRIIIVFKHTEQKQEKRRNTEG